MILGLARGRVHDYIPEQDRGSTRPTKFRVKTPTAEQAAMIQDSLTPKVQGELQLAIGTASVLAVRLCLVGWENFCTKDEAGNVVALKFAGNQETGATAADLDLIPEAIIRELYRFIRSLGEVSKADFPQSVSQPV